jgi:hypothetical protein
MMHELATPIYSGVTAFFFGPGGLSMCLVMGFLGGFILGKLYGAVQ